jgi:mono/diheme cytochrome c family protein
LSYLSHIGSHIGSRIGIPLSGLLALGLSATAAAAQEAAPPGRAFLDKHCSECHDADTKKGGLDLAATPFAVDDARNAALWVKVHDRVRDGEMPPKKKKERPEPAALKAFLDGIAAPLAAADLAREAREGRSTWRRLNRYEYENTLRDLLDAPWLQIKEILPEDGESHRFNKSGEALDVSHVQMAQYLSAAEYALRQVIAAQPAAPATEKKRLYARDQNSFAGKMKFTEFNRSPERATFPVLGSAAQPDVRAYKAPLTVGSADPKTRDQEAMGVVASSYEPIELRFDRFQAPQSGRYKLRFSAFSVWVGPGKEPRWWTPDLDVVSPGHRPEPVTVYSETRPRLLRWQGAFDVGAEPTVRELDVWLLKGEQLRVDAARLFRSRPPNWHNPLATREGTPGVAFRWMEVEGPLLAQWPGAGHRLLFDNLPVKPAEGAGGDPEVESAQPAQDAERLLRRFMQRAYRQAVAEADVQRFLAVIQGALKSGSGFTEAMIAGYAGVLCSPAFVCLEEQPGTLEDHALAARLAYFLWNSEPDAELRAAADAGTLHRSETLRAQTERLLADPRSRRFVDAFLGYWIDLRKLGATSPDAELYPDYYLDDLLVESANQETELFFAELLGHDLPARDLVSADFAMLNERLATHYGIPGVEGVALRKVPLPPGSVRGGLMTQASVLKVTANGTTTSPVLRGAWIMERILGKPPAPPPPGVGAVEPDTRGATTIRQQLDKHRTAETCSACHAKIDPAGFALESFDVFGGWRDRYRALGDGKHEAGFGKNGQPFTFHLAQPVDASGALPDGRAFQDVRELKKLLLVDERQIARNLVQQLVMFATGAAVRFGDRARIEQILDHAAVGGYGVRTLVHELVQSQLFRCK